MITTMMIIMNETFSLHLSLFLTDGSCCLLSVDVELAGVVAPGGFGASLQRGTKQKKAGRRENIKKEKNDKKSRMVKFKERERERGKRRGQIIKGTSLHAAPQRCTLQRIMI